MEGVFITNGTAEVSLDSVTVCKVDLTYQATTLTPTTAARGEANSFEVTTHNGGTDAATLGAPANLSFTDNTSTYTAYVDTPYPTIPANGETAVVFGSTNPDGSGGAAVPGGLAAGTYTPKVYLTGTAGGSGFYIENLKTSSGTSLDPIQVSRVAPRGRARPGRRKPARS